MEVVTGCMGMGCLILALNSFYMRKTLLKKYGYEMSINDFYHQDFKRLKAVVEKEPSLKKKRFLNIVNYSVSVFFLLGF